MAASDLLTAGLLRHITQRYSNAEGQAADIHKWLEGASKPTGDVPGTVKPPKPSEVRSVFTQLAGLSPEDYDSTAKALRTGFEKASMVIGDERFQAMWDPNGQYARASGLSPKAMKQVQILYTKKVREKGPSQDAVEVLAEAMEEVRRKNIAADARARKPAAATDSALNLSDESAQ